MSSAHISSTPIASPSHAPKIRTGAAAGEVVESGRVESSPRAETTPRARSPSRGGLLPPFGVRDPAHLPTPQSPGSRGAYSTAKGHPPESPLSYGLRTAVPSMTRMASRDKRPVAAAASFITPEPSPEARRRLPLGHQDLASVFANVSVIPTPHTPPLRSQNEPKSGAGTILLTQSPTLSPFPSSRDITPSSGLSSPFMERLSLADRADTRSRTPHDVSVGPAIKRTSSVPMHVDDMFPHEGGISSTPPPLSAPVPKRPAGGEIHRIRLQMVAEQAARQSESEARRPNYLVRERRISSNDASADHDVTEVEQEGLPSGLGVTESPVKGRRLKLFQETSEESFEQSLLAGGYPGYGYTPAYGEPQTPDKKGKNPLSQRAVQWLQQATPGQPGPSNVPSDPESDWVPSEKEILKRKRLAAFQDHPEISEPPKKLHPVEIEGKGRLLLNVLPEDMPSQYETPAKKRGSRRRRRGGVASAKKRGHVTESVPDQGEVLKPDWPDSSFPWCMRVQERAETARLEQEERFKWIDRYLDSDQDSGDEDLNSEPDKEAPPMRTVWGKMVRPSFIPRGRPDVNDDWEGNFDPADARVALKSRRSAREFAMHLRQRASQNCCICEGRRDGGPAVQCDDCDRWFHLECVDIRDPAELEDTWYCADCLGLGQLASDPASEPTFVPTDEGLSTVRGYDPLFYQGSLQESPSTPWTMSRAPRTPIRGRDLTLFSSRSTWGDSSRVSPSTPLSSSQSVRVYSSPGPFDQLHPRESPFDPFTTPSRGIKFGAPVTTPRNLLWPSRSGGQIRTPIRAGRPSGSGLQFGAFDDSGGPAISPYRNIYSYDDTPVRRSKPREDTKGLVSRRLWDSSSPAQFGAALPQESLARMNEDRLLPRSLEQLGNRTVPQSVGSDDVL
ncbi:hypothetical protein SCP_0115740 [Sparassis crispa]|uniref:PHD-type domain-containing protein n=1 Tax=Sparassis crispa TaxID=139825 RepID=A0A401G968_9APHY|nr:hypothetical protein SCP_0115740 [Sparassis crispa]GBE78683.1 hypothetical protein SCP_0115740 [Sparassis crispa]